VDIVAQDDSFGTRRAARAAERSGRPAADPPLQLENKAVSSRPQRPLAVKPSGTVARASRTRRTKENARRFTAFTASTASVGLAMSLMFALPADAAQPSTLSASAIHTIVDNNGHTAAQILDVSGNVTMPALQRDNQIAAALTGIVSQEGGADAGTAQAAISYALQYGGSRTTIVETALSYLGDPYVLGGSSHSGIDCSGLVMVAYDAVGIHMGHLVSDEDGVATPITEAQALPGDIVVFNDEQHIGIYLGNGLLIQAPEPGTPVNIVPVWSIPHHFARILPAGD
jgi:cell wall-associated NlpC family hydrolase